MSWLQKSIGNHIAGANKFLHKSINNGSNFFGKLHQVVGTVKDKYTDTRNNVLRGISDFNPKLGEIAKEGVGMLEQRAMDFINPLGNQAQPLLELGGKLGSVLKNY